MGDGRGNKESGKRGHQRQKPTDSVEKLNENCRPLEPRSCLNTQERLLLDCTHQTVKGVTVGLGVITNVSGDNETIFGFIVDNVQRKRFTLNLQKSSEVKNG